MYKYVCELEISCSYSEHSPPPFRSGSECASIAVDDVVASTHANVNKATYIIIKAADRVRAVGPVVR